MTALGSAILALAWLAAVFVPLEWAYPARALQARLRPGLATDLAFFAGQQLVFGGLVVWVFSLGIALAPTLESLVPLRAAFGRQPVLLQALEAVLLGDLAMYWGHRWQHHSSFLWRFHAVHHSAEQLDFLAAHREHPVDGLYTQLFMNAPALVLGFSPEGMLGLVAFRGLWATFVHANVRVPMGPLAHVLGSPQFHHLHHVCEREVGNYANLAPWLDHLFGTHKSGEGLERALETGALALGLDEPAPRTYLGLLLHPFRRRR